MTKEFNKTTTILPAVACKKCGGTNFHRNVEEEASLVKIFIVDGQIDDEIIHEGDRQFTYECADCTTIMMAMSNTAKKIAPELRKARLRTGETLWVKIEGDFVRIDNIPVSTNEYAFGDLVLLTVAPDGMYEVAERIKWGGYTTAMLTASNDDGITKEVLEVLEKSAIIERVDEDHVIVATKPQVLRR
jgi:hypothetical protein